MSTQHPSLRELLRTTHPSFRAQDEQPQSLGSQAQLPPPVLVPPPNAMDAVHQTTMEVLEILDSVVPDEWEGGDWEEPSEPQQTSLPFELFVPATEFTDLMETARGPRL